MGEVLKEHDASTEESDNSKKNGPPDTANQSIFTAVNGGDRDGNQSSPITSPIVEKIHNSIDIPTTSPESKRLALDNKFNLLLKEKYQGLISIMKDLSDCTEINYDPRLKQLIGVDCEEGQFDWKNLIEIAEDVFNNYSMKMQEFTKEFDDLNKDFLIWQEATYMMDSEKVSKRIESQEQWIHSKEAYLNYKKKELSKSAELIDNALKYLRKD